MSSVCGIDFSTGAQRMARVAARVPSGEDPAEAILARTARRSADALGVTAQPARWLTAGETGASLAARSLIPVLLVRPP